MIQKSFFKTGLIVLILLLVLFSLPNAQAGNKASIQEILTNPDQYDGQEVIVQGNASKVKVKVSKKGNEYTTFSLIDGSGKSINVFIWGNPKIRDGQKVTVSGIFQKIKKVGKYTFYNEIEASSIK